MCPLCAAAPHRAHAHDIIFLAPINVLPYLLLLSLLTSLAIRSTRLLYATPLGPLDTFLDNLMDLTAAADALLALYVMVVIIHMIFLQAATCLNSFAPNHCAAKTASILAYRILTYASIWRRGYSYTIFIEKGRPRSKAVIKHRLPDVGSRLLLHLLALANPLSLVWAAFTGTSLVAREVRPRLLRLLLLPQALSTSVWVLQATLPQVAWAVGQLAALACLQIVFQAVPTGITPGHLTPLVVLMAAMTLRLLWVLLRPGDSNAARRQSTVADAVLRSDDLDEICECMVRENPLLKGAQEGHPEFVRLVLCACFLVREY